jgi:hypothetical protein
MMSLESMDQKALHKISLLFGGRLDWTFTKIFNSRGSNGLQLLNFFFQSLNLLLEQEIRLLQLLARFTCISLILSNSLCPVLLG